MSSGVERRVVYRTFREYLLLWEISIFPTACRISAEALCVSERAAAPEAWQLLLLFAIYGRLFALMLPNDRVEAGAGSLFLETVSHNKTVSYDKTFQASDTPLLRSGASAPSRELRCSAASCSVWGQSPAHRATDYTELATTTTNNTLLLCHGSQMVCSVLSFQCPKGFPCVNN